MKAWRIWFKDDSSVLINAEDEITAEGKAQEIADRNQGPMPKYPDEVKQWRKAKTIRKCESIS